MWRRNEWNVKGVCTRVMYNVYVCNLPAIFCLCVCVYFKLCLSMTSTYTLFLKKSQNSDCNINRSRLAIQPVALRAAGRDRFNWRLGRHYSFFILAPRRNRDMAGLSAAWTQRYTGSQQRVREGQSTNICILVHSCRNKTRHML